MKKLILIIVAAAFALGVKAQADTINYIVVIKDSVQQQDLKGTWKVTNRMEGFRTQTSLQNYLNESVDSTSQITIFDVRTKKPIKATVSTEVVEVIVTERRPKWRVQ